MDYIEVIFGVSPDGGNGSIEAAIFSVCLLGIFLVVRFYGKGLSLLATQPRGIVRR